MQQNQAAKELRKNVVRSEEERFHREQRQEGQLVSEVYHNFRSNGYFAKDLFLEYLYPTTSINGERKKLNPELIFEKNGEGPCSRIQGVLGQKSLC